MALYVLSNHIHVRPTHASNINTVIFSPNNRVVVFRHKQHADYVKSSVSNGYFITSSIDRKTLGSYISSNSTLDECVDCVENVFCDLKLKKEVYEFTQVLPKNI
jgi:hypothetical protein